MAFLQNRMILIWSFFLGHAKHKKFQSIGYELGNEELNDLLLPKN